MNAIRSPQSCCSSSGSAAHPAGGCCHYVAGTDSAPPTVVVVANFAERGLAAVWRGLQTAMQAAATARQ